MKEPKPREAVVIAKKRPRATPAVPDAVERHERIAVWLESQARTKRGRP